MIETDNYELLSINPKHVLLPAAASRGAAAAASRGSVAAASRGHGSVAAASHGHGSKYGLRSIDPIQVAIDLRAFTFLKMVTPGYKEYIFELDDIVKRDYKDITEEEIIQLINSIAPNTNTAIYVLRNYITKQTVDEFTAPVQDLIEKIKHGKISDKDTKVFVDYIKGAINGKILEAANIRNYKSAAELQKIIVSI